MRKPKLILLIIALIGVVLSSCKKDKEEVQPDYSISFLVNGSSMKVYEDGSTYALYDKHLSSYDTQLSSPPVAPTLSIGGKIEGSEIHIGIINFSGCGEYLIYGSFGSPCEISYSEPGDRTSSRFFGTAGSVNVTTFDDKIVQGTFEFIAESANHESKKVTQGNFKIKVATM